MSTSEKITETETQLRKDALRALRGIAKEVDADSWMYSKPRHAMR
jgi:hypothetical protein